MIHDKTFIDGDMEKVSELNEAPRRAVKTEGL